MKTSLFEFVIPPKGASKGHVRFFGIMPSALGEVGVLANLCASILFEQLGAQGTNIIGQIGTERRLDVIARFEDDGLDFLWQPKQLQPNEMEDVQGKIKAKLDRPAQKEPPRPKPAPKEQEKGEDQSYLAKQLIRIP